jgi:hypothetical protein
MVQKNEVALTAAEPCRSQVTVALSKQLLKGKSVKSSRFKEKNIKYSPEFLL